MNRIGMKLAGYLGANMGDLLAIPPFSSWNVARSTEEELPKKEIWYEFDGHGVEVICDESERIRTIFIHRGDGEVLIEIEFSQSRTQVRKRLGTPSKIGEVAKIPGLGVRGAWDRFDSPRALIHIQYELDRDAIDMITLISPDWTP